MTAVPLSALPAPPLAAALWREESPARELLGTRAVSRDSLASAVRAAAARDLDRTALLAAWRMGLDVLDPPPAALESLAKLERPGSVVVVAGQQPGLLLGPHLGLSKALQAVSMAEWIEAELGVAAVPVFWSATEDHDHAEADHVVWTDGNGGAERVRVALPHDRRMLSAVPWSDVALDTVRTRLGGLPEIAGLGVCGPRAGESFGTTYSRSLQALLGSRGLVVVEPAWLRDVASRVGRHELEHPGALHGLVSDRLERLRQLGLPSPLDLRRPELFFVVLDGRREVAAWDGAGFVVRGHRIAPEELAPRSIAWNVVSRVLAQNVALPVAAQVCGPSELAYGSVVAGLHAEFDVPAPLLASRLGVTWIETPVARAARKEGIDPVEVVVNGAAGLAPVAAEASNLARERLEELLAQLESDTTNAVRNRHGALRHAAERYVEALRARELEREAHRVRRNAVVLGGLRPGGALQERSASPLPFLARAPGDLLSRWQSCLREWWRPVHHVSDA